MLNPNKVMPEIYQALVSLSSRQIMILFFFNRFLFDDMMMFAEWQSLETTRVIFLCIEQKRTSIIGRRDKTYSML